MLAFRLVWPNSANVSNPAQNRGVLRAILDVVAFRTNGGEFRAGEIEWNNIVLLCAGACPGCGILSEHSWLASNRVCKKCDYSGCVRFAG
jgi:hypothetical protein